MPYETHGLRHDTEALFARLRAEIADDRPATAWQMTPCIVVGDDHQITVVRSAQILLAFADDAQVICGWPGAMRQDVFEFTVGQFRAYARDHRGGEESMTSGDETKPEEAAADPAAGGLCSLRMRAVLLQMQDEAKAAPSRERSLAITNLEQAIMWQDKAEPQDVLISECSEAAEPEAAPLETVPQPAQEAAP